MGLFYRIDDINKDPAEEEKEFKERYGKLLKLSKAVLEELLTNNWFNPYTKVIISWDGIYVESTDLGLPISATGLEHLCK